MCDVKKYIDIKKEIFDLSGDDIMQIISECDNQDTKDFYVAVLNYRLQANQKKAIKDGVY